MIQRDVRGIHPQNSSLVNSSTYHFSCFPWFAWHASYTAQSILARETDKPRFPRGTNISHGTNIAVLPVTSLVSRITGTTGAASGSFQALLKKREHYLEELMGIKSRKINLYTSFLV